MTALVLSILSLIAGLSIGFIFGAVYGLCAFDNKRIRRLARHIYRITDDAIDRRFDHDMDKIAERIY